MTIASDSVMRHLDSVEANAYRDMFAAAPEPLARQLGLAVHNIAGTTLLIAPGIPAPEFNRVIGMGNERPITESELGAISERFRAAGVKQWWAHVSPGAHAEQTMAQLRARGFTPPDRISWVKVLRGIETPAPVATPATVRIAHAGDACALSEAICAAFGMPVAIAPWFATLVTRKHWHAIAAELDGNIIGGGLVHIQGNTAWLGAGGVRPEARRLRAHRAIMTQRIQTAIDAGCTQITTETGAPINNEPNPSLRNMHACGFSPAFSRANFAAPV